MYLKKKYGVKMWSGLIGSRWVSVADFDKHGHEPSGFIKSGEFLDQLSNYQLIKKDYAPWT
jgi:hypothetical protein